jgi:hypothetical protein
MTKGGWRLYNWYLISGMGLFFILAILGPKPTPKEYWEEFAHYDPAMVTGGVVRGTVRYENAADCTAKARQKFHYEWIDVVGQRDLPADGINGPYIWGCQKVTHDRRPLSEIRR